MSNLGKQPAVDPDEDVDDLDDVLDSMKAEPPSTRGAAAPKATKNAPPTGAAASGSSAGAPTAGEDNPLDIFGAEFAKELQAGMAEWLQELGKGPQEGEDPDELLAMREAWEKMLIAGMDGTDGAGETLGEGAFVGPPPPPLPTSKPPVPPVASGSRAKDPASEKFQDKINSALEKLKDSEETLRAQGDSTNNPLAKLLADLDLNGDEGPAEGDDGADLQKMLEGVMAQLMSKEILYDPLKELDEKYPTFLKDNASKLSASDKEKYEKQSVKVKEIVAIFEKKDYDDASSKYQMQVLELMNEMQSYGAPPTEIMGELPPGMAVGADGMPSMDGCVIC